MNLAVIDHTLAIRKKGGQVTSVSAVRSLRQHWFMPSYSCLAATGICTATDLVDLHKARLSFMNDFFNSRGSTPGNSGPISADSTAQDLPDDVVTSLKDFAGNVQVFAHDLTHVKIARLNEFSALTTRRQGLRYAIRS